MPSNHLILCCPLSSCLQSFPPSGSFQMNQLFSSRGQSIGVSASTTVLPMNIQDWFPLGNHGKEMGEKMETVTDFIFLGSKSTADGDCSHEIKRHLLLGRKAMAKLDSILKSRDITLPTKVLVVKAMIFSSSHFVWMWELDHKKGWTPKDWCFWPVALEKTLESPMDCKEIKPVNTKRNQPWIFIRRTDAETETPILWPPDVKSWLTGKDPDAGKDWGQ